MKYLKIKYHENLRNKIVIITCALVVILLVLMLFWSIIIALGYCSIYNFSWFNFQLAFNHNSYFLISFLLSLLTILAISVMLFKIKFKNFSFEKNHQKKTQAFKNKEFYKIGKENLILLNKKVGLFKSKLNQHTLLIGATGSGKTTTALSIINQLVYKLNQTVIIIDGKGDSDLIDKVQTIDNNAFIWTIGGDNKYNPFASKSHIVLADKIMSLFDFSEPHYQAIAHNYLLLLIKILINKSIDISLENIIKYFPIKELKKLVSKTENDYDVLKSFIENENDIKGLQHRLNVYLQQLGYSLGNESSLTNLTTKHKIILFSLNSFKYPELASNVGKLIIQDLKEFATIKPKDQIINLVLDEFNVFVTDAVINLINKSRSFKYQCFLCFQEIKSLEVNKKNLTDIIFGNVSNIICQKVLDPNTAEYLAKVFGTKTSEALTHQIDYQDTSVNKGSIRAVEQYLAHPNNLKNLELGQAYVKILLPSSKQYIDKIDIENYSLV